MLNPKSYKELYKTVALSLNLPEEEVIVCVNAYWQYVRATLSALPHLRVNVPALGIFTVKDWRLEDRLAKTTAVLKKLSKEKAEEFGMPFLEKRLVALLEHKEKDNQKKQFVKLHKNARKHNNDLEKQGADSGGDKE